MSEKASALRIGIFVTLGVAIVLAALFLFGIRSAFQPTHEFETYTTGDVEGLAVGSVVTLRGVEVGKVVEIGFSWNLYEPKPPACVVVRCAVKQDITPRGWGAGWREDVQKVVAQGLRAVVQTNGITGSSIIALQTLDPKLYPPLKVPWTPKYLYVPSAPSQLGRLLASVDRTLGNLEKLDVGAISRSLTRVLDTADTTLKGLNGLDVGRLSHSANNTLQDASAAIREIQGLAQDARADLKAMKLEAVGSDANRLLDNLDAKLSVLLDKLSGVDVRALNETLAGTRDAARSLNQALDELKRYPSGFLFGGAPPLAPALEEKKK
ncbi:MAG TPA: MlaD family protein [Thermoanaerobaculia bacterium]|nr:MlaD family protein [Thermoanaerobaculia bacterium]